MTMRTAMLAAIGLAVLSGMCATPRPASAYPYCYDICARYSEGVCVEHRHSCLGTSGGPGGGASRMYGAIAYSPSTGRSGYSDHYPNSVRADARALAECGMADCKVAAWFYNHCGALATGAAEALATCRRFGAGCRVAFTHCSG
jgi:Domain of unknown function (DUF4189)